MLLSPGGPQPLSCNLSHVVTSAPHRNMPFFLAFPLKPHQIDASPISNASSFGSLFTERGWFCAHALRKQRGHTSSVLEVNDFDDDDEDDSDEEAEAEDDDEGEFDPFAEMKKWTRNKPRGFGEGKVYDTSIEEKLFDEIAQSRRAQLANINRLKNNPSKPHSKEGHNQVQKAPEPFPSGIRVRLFNLPKKKNVHRDLRSAFKEVPGIINIAPAVSGNQKTRDPVCKGFAFVDLKSLEDANRFVRIVSGQNITFGKIQKQIKCELINPPSPDTASEFSALGTDSAPKVVHPTVEADNPDADFELDNASLNLSEEATSNESKELQDNPLSAWEEIQRNLKFAHVSEVNDGDGLKPTVDSATASSSSKPRDKAKANKKKQDTKRKAQKGPKLGILGSANRLKVREKTLLTGVLSKYAANAASTSREN
ncbi:uncharacterized protein LOC131144555 isoform X2 [Malania oleifera]|uniref:uncharacterized protein LOC131144555 isoform X2 n=1 Tax=Malania oleifera TaxID=397392 RepID=UPI0025AE8549|nr:uncharacterized protein LOC131144555 isoform X2 [Malania oleifera]